MRPDSRKPWSMKWVVLGILLFIVPYTVINIVWRKPGRAYEPYNDGKTRATTGRLLEAGYNRFPVTAEHPGEPARFSVEGAAATIRTAPGGLSPDLQQALIDQPSLPATIGSVSAAAALPAGRVYVVQFVYQLADPARELAEIHAYRRGDRISIVPHFAPLATGLQARNRQGTLRISIPATAVPVGKYTVSILGSSESRSWSLQVN